MRVARASQSSESFELAFFLALSGGLMDAYSYIARGGVFANAQTGNLLLLGVNIASGAWGACAHYFFPVVGFAAGVVVAHNIKIVSSERRLHWRQLALLAEVVLLGVVSLMPSELNLLANSLTSLACGIQVQAFRKVHGRAFATTMCIGNLRSGTQALVAYAHQRRPGQLRDGLIYYAVIATFVTGAIVGNLLIKVLGLRAILASPVLLLVAMAIMFVDREGMKVSA